LGAHVTLIDGLITDCAAEIARSKTKEGWFDMSTLKEPYRVEGKKTLGYELTEQCDWELPDVILYPTGGGTGLIGMWKAFDEMESLGWIGTKRPRMSLCKLAVVRQSFARSKPEKKPQRNFRMHTRSPLVCVFRKRSAIS
jgi:threonine synthase